MTVPLFITKQLVFVIKYNKVLIQYLYYQELVGKPQVIPKNPE